MTKIPKSEKPLARHIQGYIPALKLIGIGWYFATAVLLGVGGGYWLDQVTGWSPIFTLLGVVLALASAFYGAYKMIAGVIARPPVEGGKGQE